MSALTCVSALTCLPYASLQRHLSRALRGMRSKGSLWLPSGSDLVGKSVTTLVIDPWIPTTLYAGTASGVYKSTTSGVFWTPANAGFPELKGVFSLLVDQLNRSIVYVGTGIGVYRSINSGESWSSFGLDGKKISTLALSAAKPRTLFAGGDDGLFSRQLETYIYLPVIQRSS